jgi:hypothetical protein
MQSFDRCRLDEGVLVVDLEALLGREEGKHDVLPGKSLLDVIGLLINIDAAIGADATSKSVPMKAL